MRFNRYAFLALTAFALAACASTPQPDAEAAAREAAYQQCLQENMAIAMAWEAIETMCRERTSADSDPLDLKPPED
jgi:PBP1b-binding outer membrane lipoprotein LpoB